MAITIDRIREHVYRVGSHERLFVFLVAASGAPGSVFWPSFLEAWSMCDVTWADRHRLLSALRKQAVTENPQPYWATDAQRLYAELPRMVPVYRGCRREGVRGVAWTLDLNIAVGFAQGHRGIRVPDPVVAAATINKQRIFAVITDRQEAEIVLDPRYLRNLQVTDHPANRAGG